MKRSDMWWIFLFFALAGCPEILSAKPTPGSPEARGYTYHHTEEDTQTGIEYPVNIKICSGTCPAEKEDE